MSVATARLVVPVNESDHVLGPPNAPVTMVEYGDYQCPYCRAAHPIVAAVRARMGDQLRFAFRHFPLTTIHPHAQSAAEAAEAAGARNHFWEMHDLLFQNQHALDVPHLVRYAALLRLDVASFEQELFGHVWAERVRAHFMSGVRSGVNGTPTFFINDVRHDGSYNADELLAAVIRAMPRPVHVPHPPV
jgi:protein-disulfide isomerase